MWKPIETAPKDGSLLLLCGGRVDDHDTPDGLEHRVVTGWWDAEAWSDFEGQGHWRHCSYDSGIYGEYARPTHWMAAPQPIDATRPEA